MLKVPNSVKIQLKLLENLVENHPVSIPLVACADFLGVAPDSLRRSVELGLCPFAVGWKSQEAGYRGCKIPTATFWLWYTAGRFEAVAE